MKREWISALGVGGGEGEEMKRTFTILFACLLMLPILGCSTITSSAEQTRYDNSWYPYLRVSILSYVQEATNPDWSLDNTNYGDPFFHIKVDENGDGSFDYEVESQTFENQLSLSNPFFHDFVLFGDVSTIKMQINVYDNDPIDNDRLDYVPENGYSYIHTMSYDYLKANSYTFGPYDGEDDGYSNEKDCRISYRVELFNWNVAPIVDDISLYGKTNLYVSTYEPISLYANVFDPNDDPLTYEWDFDDGFTQSSDIGSHIYAESGTYYISFTASDPLVSTVKYATVHVSDFPYSQYTTSSDVDGESGQYNLVTTYSKTLNPEISTFGNYIPWPFEFTIWIALVVDFKIDHVGDVTIDVSKTWDDYYEIENDLLSSNDEYTLSILPHFEVRYLESGDPITDIKVFDLPIPTTNELYPGQPSINLSSTTFYFWDRMVEVSSMSSFNSLGELVEIQNTFNIATIDLVPYIDALINYVLPGWETLMDVGRDFSDFIGFAFDRKLDLQFNINLKTMIEDNLWLHQKTQSQYIWDTNTPNVGVWGSNKVASPITFTSSQDTKVNYSGFSYVTTIFPYLQHTSKVRVSGSIDLEYGYTSIFGPSLKSLRLFDSSDYGLYLEDSKSTVSSLTRSINVPPFPDNDGDLTPDKWDSDDDNDGVPDTQDRFPFDSTESKDADNDGIGDNADPDDDNDGVWDSQDAFPYDSSESIDTDGDGVGDNADTDDDNDGVSDGDDLNPKDATVTTRKSHIWFTVITIIIVVVVISLALYLRKSSRKKSQSQQYPLPPYNQQQPPPQYPPPPPTE